MSIVGIDRMESLSCCGGCASLIAMGDPPPSPSKPGNAPAPGSVPKLPKTIFNLEKKGSGGFVWGSEHE
jgi:hypothetical protein